MPDIPIQVERGNLLAQWANRYAAPGSQQGGIGKNQSPLITAAFGGLAQYGDAPPQPLSDTPELITGFETVVPTGAVLLPENVLSDTVDDFILIFEPGLYQVIGFINAVVAAGGGYAVQLYRNEEPTGIVWTEDLSQQSTQLTLTLTTIYGLEEGDIMQLYGSSDSATPIQFDMYNSLFFITRIR